MRIVVSMTGCLFAVTLAPAPASAQATSAPQPAFEVVSVKPNRSPETMMAMQNGPSGFVASNTPLLFLLMRAFEVSAENILHAPGWIDSERFDVEGRVGDGYRDQYRDRAVSRGMLRALLVDRFKLAVREVPRDGLGYSLVTARPDGRLGAQLRSSTLVCEQEGVKCLLDGAAGELHGRGMPMGRLAGYLGLVLETVVFDKTGLTGAYDFDLQWTPEQRSPGPPVDLAVAAHVEGGALFTAAIEQLGLRLRPERISQPSLVVEHVERPTPN